MSALSAFFDERHIVEGVFAVGRDLVVRDGSDDFCGISKGKRIVGNAHFPGDERACADDAVTANHCPAQDNASHADDCVVPDRASMDDGVVSDGDAFAYVHRVIRVCVHSSVVLYISVVANHDCICIAADDGVVPDTYIFSHKHIADDVRARRNPVIFLHGSTPFDFLIHKNVQSKFVYVFVSVSNSP